MSMHIQTATAISLALLASNPAGAADVKQVWFDAYNRDSGACELSELHLMGDTAAKTYHGRIEKSGSGARAALCNVSIPRAEFDLRYQYCALASVEATRPAGYVCEVFYFKDSVVFSYSYGGLPSELPMCSFVCPTPQPPQP